MAVKKQKYYVVWQGVKPGIYTTWETAQRQINNFPNALYKSFPTKEEAEDAFRHGYVKKPRAITTTKTPATSARHTKYIPESIAVDAACSGNPGVMEYQGVWTNDGTQLFHVGPFQQGTNNIGEFLALVHALAFLQNRKDTTTPIYSDSKTAMAWVRRKKANTKLNRTSKNAAIFDLIVRAEQWLNTHSWQNPILKWETEIWGEIPADFGRK